MSFYLAPSLVQLRNEVNARWPKRSVASDGWIGDASHSARKSDHNPDWSAPGRRRGVVRALDITARGIDVDLLLKHTTNDARVAYVIYNRRIYTHARGWYAYTGSNPHTSHVHISVGHTAARENQTHSWFGSASSSGSTSTSTTKSSSGGGDSIVDYLNSKGMSSSFSARKKLAQQHGITNYQGTASQNTTLLNKLKSAGSKTSSKSSSSKKNDPNRYTVRSEASIRRITLRNTSGKKTNSTPHLIGLYQRNQVKPYTLKHDQIWGHTTDQHYRWVGQLQKALNKWKGTKLAVDGSFGRRTRNRVIEWQKRNMGGRYKGTIADGVVGPLTTGPLKIKKYPN